ncbi:monothiol bacilliredoxin BrxC family protein [Deinococcus soli (ex Cha et al. 2016)]|uniref:Bacillithiol system protein YtxJ n=2 Tax=Deinococcus soli (ex Cha et al. 2016) TaxID=1309411 RepID=A0ACC6KBC7_9DEIO|nr:monothiol bacilliredoxin BrxC family protein [Deinococcus soli (ex Cha et al. 2016)]MDR6216678.1 bacillithiol system protein YtxJ [Deinococcus soli (ex Cha et al. 2016)]MDR6327499.1 bacillithiol system protein YtxJ [Deinococcus soli (ex Cha et al. 2016)]MDR6749774.1 bacillithiol system protein YtxJ [Deinococcus soli (ex Cha et al. 2016)]
MTQAAQNEAQVLVPLTTPEEVDQFLTEYPLAAVFKAGTCHKTMQGFGVLETFLQRHDLPVGFIRVVDWRPASNHVAQRTGIVHHSPQLILFRDGQPQFEVNNWDITPQALGPVFEAQVPVREGVASVATDDNVEPYRRLMRAYLDGQLSDWAFQDQYVNMFRDDASLRSQREFELLSRLFGDPDAYHGGLHQLGAPQGRGDLRARVQELLTELG